jgi:hypothetical protein
MRCEHPRPAGRRLKRSARCTATHTTGCAEFDCIGMQQWGPVPYGACAPRRGRRTSLRDRLAVVGYSNGALERAALFRVTGRLLAVPRQARCDRGCCHEQRPGLMRQRPGPAHRPPVRNENPRVIFRSASGGNSSALGLAAAAGVRIRADSGRSSRMARRAGRRQPPKRKFREVFKSAITGRFVTRRQAKRSPRTTFKQRFRIGRR